jgi:SM-20-related protein
MTSGPPSGAKSGIGPPRADRVRAFLRAAFLTDLECDGLRAIMDRAPRIDGGVREADQPDAESIDRGGRRASECLVPEDVLRSMTDRVCWVAPDLASFFGEPLAEYETPHFVVYEPGDFYRPHRDLYRDVEVPDPIGRRRVAVVVFLNDPRAPGDQNSDGGPGAEGFGGGSLRLCSHELEGFDADAAWEVPAERGLLVAFRADTWHEVTPVTGGRRYTVVALLLSPTTTGRAAYSPGP